MIIRSWTQNDVEQISKLEQACFSDPWSKKMIEETTMLANFLGFVIEVDGEIKGYIGACSVLDEGEILLVAVDVECRNKGYGKILVNTLLGEYLSRGVASVFLEVRKSNISAISCYTKCGFYKIAERARYYSDGEDAIIMERKL